MRESRRTLKRTIEAAALQEHSVLVQRNPFFPDLLNQPDVISVPHLGRLVAIYLYAPTHPINWRNVLTAIEDLFELKTSVQHSAIAIAVQDVTHGVNQASANAIELLEQLFDAVLTVEEGSRHQDLTRRLREAIRDIPSKERFFHLWAAEKKRNSDQLSRFSEERYRGLVEDHPPSVQNHEKLISRVAADADNLGLDLHREALVRTPKEAIGGLQERSRFSFDLGFRDRQGKQVLIDAVAVGRYGARPLIRYLMTKARFTSYEPAGNAPGGAYRLVERQEPLRRILIVDGNFAGPKHDPYRYVRALVSVGWELERADGDFLPRLANANI
jgi:hypothetical protein